MPLKYKYAKADEVPEEHKALYVEKELEAGKPKVFVLDVDGAVDFDKFKEFRTNNTKLIEENRKYKDRYEGIEDPDRARALLETLKDVEIGEAEKFLKKGGIDKVVEGRTTAMKADYERKLAAATAQLSTIQSRLEHVEISQVTVEQATKLGLKPTAVLDITSRARSVFKLVEGKVVALEADGKTVRYGKDGTSPLTIQEWTELQRTEAPHLFEASTGSGAAGGSGSGGAGYTGKNPWLKESRDYTQQVMLEKNEPEKAKRLKAAAGFA